MSVASMSRSVVLWFVVGAAAATAGWLAVQTWHKPPDENTVLRAYSISPELAREIGSAVDVAVKPYNASVTPSGQLLVTAPPSYQRGVEQLLKEVAAHNPSAPPPIRIDAWFVTASAGSHMDSPMLKEIEPALRAIEQTKGPMHFELLEELSTQTLATNRNSDVTGQRTSMSAAVSVLSDNQNHPVVGAQFKLHANQMPVPAPGITAQAQLRPGELLVLGQSGLADKGGERQLYYIVRATL